MKSEAIKASLAMQGITQVGIARNLGIDHGFVGRVINGRARSRKVEDALAKILGRRPFGETPKPGRKKSAWNPEEQVAA